ncbi:hypothetical protein RhiJN_02114 [Ceratobasidium sp. AG-Ba]|nr:hypothetical protein RhiJN_02114 [Ceratobasidium sp. AG-Ba]
MTRKQINNRPSTPPPSVQTSPTDSREIMPHTPLKVSRSRGSNFAPATPQSLRSSRSPLKSKKRDNQIHMLTPLRVPSIHIPDWRVRQDTPPKRLDHQPFKSSDPATPDKLPGPFTPQASKKTREPLVTDLSNCGLGDELHLRGCLTDPPPRRRTEQHHNSDQQIFGSLSVKPLDINLPIFDEITTAQNTSATRTPIHSEPQGACASCGSCERLSVLQPCEHHICASCVAGSLNVIEGKGLMCMHCSVPVQSFNITSSPLRAHTSLPVERVHPISPSIDRLPFKTYSMGNSAALCEDVVVLRIENVPWDITPPMLESWLENPIILCHILLDRKDGRTLNHAYIEVTSDVARNTLRSHQNKILGQGRRLRPVTITRSEQEELMHDLFPSWTGKFKATNPVYEAANGSMEPPVPEFLTKPELYVVAHLIQSPGSHFLKVPCLAYWSLLSILVKFPAPDVFAPAPDLLFAHSLGALEKYETWVGTSEYDCVLHTKLIAAAIHCRAFADFQLQVLLRFTNRPPPVINQSLAAVPKVLSPAQGLCHQAQVIRSHNPIQGTRTENTVDHRMDHGRYAYIDPRDRVAQDFGIDPTLVYALAERLALHSSNTLDSLERMW